MLTTWELRQAPGSQSADRSDGIRADADRPSGGPNPLGCHPQPIRTDPPGALGMREKSAMWVRWWWERRSCTIISGNLNVTWGCFGLRSAWRERLETYQAPPSNFRFQSTPMHPQEPPQAQAYCGKQLDEPPSDSPPPSAPPSTGLCGKQLDAPPSDGPPPSAHPKHWLMWQATEQAPK